MVKPQDAAGDFSRAVAAIVRDLMTEHHVTQVQLADLLGRSQAFVSERTGGVRPIDTDIVEALASLLHWTPQELWAEVQRRIEQ
jgi:predicted transcriptional regulator